MTGTGASAAGIQLRISLQRGDFHLAIDQQIPGRGITAIFGPSGCGKTTLLRAIAGLESVDRRQTRIDVCGKIWCATDTYLPVHQRRVGYVFQEASLFEHLSVQKNLEFGSKRSPVKHNGEGITSQISKAEVVELLDLTSLLPRDPAHLSGGERQRVALGRALLANPEFLLMDEPLAALDQGRKQEILPYLERLQQLLAIPMLYVSHALDEIVQLADHLLLMDRGRITAAGPLAELLCHHPQLTHRGDAFTLLKGDLVTRRNANDLAQVSLGDHFLYLSADRTSPAATARVRVYARDVSLCLDYPTHTSILNVLPVRIMDLTEITPGQCLVRVTFADQLLLARVSRYSVERLQLRRGQSVYAQIKAAAFEY